jgi:hypothetical protein
MYTEQTDLCGIFLDLNKEKKMKLESAFSKTLWGKETGTRLSKEKAWKSKKKGGLGVIDIIAWSESMVVMWILMIQERKIEKWVKIFNRWKEVSGLRRRENIVKRVMFY